MRPVEDIVWRIWAEVLLCHEHPRAGSKPNFAFFTPENGEERPRKLSWFKCQWAAGFLQVWVPPAGDGAVMYLCNVGASRGFKDSFVLFPPRLEPPSQVTYVCWSPEVRNTPVHTCFVRNPGKICSRRHPLCALQGLRM